jgi:adenylate cyclase
MDHRRVRLYGLRADGDGLAEEPHALAAAGRDFHRPSIFAAGGTPPDPNIKLVGLGTSALQLDALSTNEIAASPALQLMQQPWPWDRRVYAAVLKKLMNAGAKVVMFDFVFASETDGDDEFAQALQKYKDRVVIGELFADEQGSDSKTKKLTAPNSRLLLPGTESIIGLVNQWTDPDGVIRSVKYHTSVEHESGLDAEGYPENMIHITALAARKYSGEDVAPSDDNLHFIDFQGSAGTYRPLPIEEMFVEDLWKANFKGGLVFSNKIVVVGPMAEAFHDDHLTPLGDMPGPELQTQTMAALLHHSWLTETSPPIDFALALGLLWLGLEICLRISNASLKVSLLIGVVVVFFVACQIAFTHFKIVLPMTQPLACLMIPSSFGIVFQYALEQFERIRTATCWNVTFQKMSRRQFLKTSARSSSR